MRMVFAWIREVPLTAGVVDESNANHRRHCIHITHTCAIRFMPTSTLEGN